MNNITTFIDIMLMVVPLLGLTLFVMAQWAEHAKAVVEVETIEELADLKRRLIKRLAIGTLVLIAVWVLVYAFIAPEVRPTSSSNRVMTPQVQGEYREVEKRERLSSDVLRSGDAELRERNERNAVISQRVAEDRQKILDDVHRNEIGE